MKTRNDIRKAQFKKLLKQARREMLTDPETLTPKLRARWYAGMRRLLAAIGRRGS